MPNINFSILSKLVSLVEMQLKEFFFQISYLYLPLSRSFPYHYFVRVTSEIFHALITNRIGNWTANKMFVNQHNRIC